MGLFKDGYNSCMRYVLNNFFDGFRQVRKTNYSRREFVPIFFTKDGIDLFLGHYRITSGEGRTPESCPISKELSKKLLALPITMFLAFSMCIVNLLIPAASYHEQFTYVLFWGVVTASTLGVILVCGQDLVDVPKLYSKVKQD